jgi:phage-related minor tail protein
MSMIQFGLEAALAVLLVLCLFYCWRLDRRLSRLRAGQDGIREAARELNESVANAERAVRALKATANETGKDLQARIDSAKTVADRLGIAVGRIRSSADLNRGARL